MFGYHIEAKLAKNKKTAKTEEAAAPIININPDDVKAIAKTVVGYVTVGAAALMTTAAVLHTASEVVINNTNPANKNH